MIDKIETTFFIGGAPKAGTTSLWEYLSQHPNIYMGEEKEIYYFTHKYNKDEEWYLDHYKQYSGEKEVGDGSINILCSPKASRRINKKIEKPKIIFLFRNPVKRLVSNYKFGLKRGQKYATTQSFSDWLRGIKKSENKWTLKLGLYYKYLRIHEKCFEKENVKCILFENFVENPKKVTKGVYRFLGVEPNFNPETPHTNKSGDISGSRILRAMYHARDAVENIIGMQLRSTVTSHIRKILQRKSAPLFLEDEDIHFLSNYYYQDICKLQDYLGWDLSKWLEDLEGAR